MLNINDSYQRWHRTYYRRKDVRVYTNATLLIISLSILILAAIQPTISTIINLKETISTNRQLLTQMDQKIAQLNKLQQDYLSIDDPELINELFPNQFSPAFLGRIIKVYVYQNNLYLKGLGLPSYNWPPKTKKDNQMIVYQANIEVTGRYSDVLRFLASIEKSRLILSFDDINIKPQQGDRVILTGLLTAKVYNYD